MVMQVFDNRHVLSNKFAIFFDNDTFKTLESIGLTLNRNPAAVLEEFTEDGTKLYFKSLHLARRLFDMDHYYAEATDEELETFFSHAVFAHVEKEKMQELSDNFVRRKVSNIVQSGILDDPSSTKLIEASAIKFGVDMEFEKDSNDQSVLKLPTEKTPLKKILRFLDEDYLESPLSSNMYYTNSKRPVAGNTSN